MLLFAVLAAVYLHVAIATTRDGRCPNPQYVSSALSCSREGDDDICPWNYKCCPLTNGMNCFAPCPELAEPCDLQCPFGLKLGNSPCTVCECADDPCLSATCPLGMKCISKAYQPCAIEGRCGMTTQCVDDPSVVVDPTPKPKRCPDYWPSMGGGLRACNGPDSLCPGEEKCCQAPMFNHFGPLGGASSFCTQPCEDLTDCNLSCPLGTAVDGGCRVCRCQPDPCDALNCAEDEICQHFPTPCAHFPGRPPCPMGAGCVNMNGGSIWGPMPVGRK